jgi:hypothetical protein
MIGWFHCGGPCSPYVCAVGPTWQGNQVAMLLCRSRAGMWRWIAGRRLPPSCTKTMRMLRSATCLQSEPQHQARCASNGSRARFPAHHSSGSSTVRSVAAVRCSSHRARCDALYNYHQWSIAFLCDVSRQTVKNPLNSKAMWQRSRRLGQQEADGRRIASRQGDQGDVEYIACRGQQPRRSSFPLCMYGICSMTLPSHQLARRMLPFVQQASYGRSCVAALCATIIRLVHHLLSAQMIVCGQAAACTATKRSMLAAPCRCHQRILHQCFGCRHVADDPWFLA